MKNIKHTCLTIWIVMILLFHETHLSIIDPIYISKVYEILMKVYEILINTFSTSVTGVLALWNVQELKPQIKNKIAYNQTIRINTLIYLFFTLFRILVNDSDRFPHISVCNRPCCTSNSCFEDNIEFPFECLCYEELRKRSYCFFFVLFVQI